MTFAEPAGLFLGLVGVTAVCVVNVPVLSPLSFLGEWHSLAQWPALPQLWQFPLRHLHFPLLVAVADKASSLVESFFPFCPFVH